MSESFGGGRDSVRAEIIAVLQKIAKRRSCWSSMDPAHVKMLNWRTSQVLPLRCCSQQTPEEELWVGIEVRPAFGLQNSAGAKEVAAPLWLTGDCAQNQVSMGVQMPRGRVQMSCWRACRRQLLELQQLKIQFSSRVYRTWTHRHRTYRVNLHVQLLS